MSPIVTIVVALVAIFIAWKVLKGVMKTVALVVILAVAAWFVLSGGMG